MSSGASPETGSFAVVRELTLPQDEVVRAREMSAAIVILPVARKADGRGVYGRTTVFLAKDLRTEGLDAHYLDPSGQRVFEELNSAVVDALINIAIGIASSGAWEGLKAIIRRERASDNPLEITCTDLRPDGSGRTWNVRGDREDVLSAIDRLLEEPPSGDQ